MIESYKLLPGICSFEIVQILMTWLLEISHQTPTISSLSRFFFHHYNIKISPLLIIQGKLMIFFRALEFYNLFLFDNLVGKLFMKLLKLLYILKYSTIVPSYVELCCFLKTMLC